MTIKARWKLGQYEDDDFELLTKLLRCSTQIVNRIETNFFILTLVRNFVNRTLFVCLITSLFFVQTASAHGGEAKEGLTNLQIMLISISVCIIFAIAYNKLSWGDSGAAPLLTLVFYTGTVHILLGISDLVFLLGGTGVISIAMLPLVSSFGKSNESLFDLGLGLIVITMFVAYFVSNHDLHYIAEDYLGITTKLAELGIIILLIKHRRQLETETDPSNTPVV